MRFVGQIGDEGFEVARDAADRGVLGRELGLDVRHLVGKAGRQRLNRFLFRLLPETLVAREDRVDRREKGCFERRRQRQLFPYPRLQLVARLWLRLL